MHIAHPTVSQSLIVIKFVADEGFRISIFRLKEERDPDKALDGKKRGA